MIDCTFFLPIFTAATDKKYFRTLPLCTQDHMAALLPQGRRNRGRGGGRRAGGQGFNRPFIQILAGELNLSQSGWADQPPPQILRPSYGLELPHVYFPQLWLYGYSYGLYSRKINVGRTFPQSRTQVQDTPSIAVIVSNRSRRSTQQTILVSLFSCSLNF